MDADELVGPETPTEGGLLAERGVAEYTELEILPERSPPAERGAVQYTELRLPFEGDRPVERGVEDDTGLKI